MRHAPHLPLAAPGGIIHIYAEEVTDMIKHTLLVFILLFLATPVLAADFKEEVKESVHETGQALKKAGKEIKESAREAGREIAEGAKKVGRETKEGFKKAGRETGKAVKEVGKDIGQTFKGGDK